MKRPFTRRSAAAAAALTLAAALLGASSPAATAAGTGDTVPLGTVDVAGQQTPILASFVYHQFRDDTNPEIRGLVHGVRRIDGGTVLYYSIGADAGKPFTGDMAFRDSSFPYKLVHGTDLKLVDTTTLEAYQPLWTADTTFTSKVVDLNSGAGELRVGWAVFSELPANVTAVQVVMPWGTSAGEVPVEDGALTPVVDDPAPYVGEGWPKIPEGSELSGADPAKVTFPLAKRSSDTAGAAAVEETPKRVAVTLDANVLFATGSAELTAKAQKTLDAVAADIKERGTGKVVVTGHTDSDGSDASNQKLSEKRAASVLSAIKPASGSNVTFVAVGKGETEPVASNDTAKGKQENRRVTITYSVDGAAK